MFQWKKNTATPAKIRPPWRTQRWSWYLLAALAPLVELFAVQLITLQSVGTVLNWFAAAPGAAVLTYLVLLAAELLLSTLYRTLLASVLTLLLPCTILAVVSHLKEVINGTPLLISDFAMVGRMGDIAGFLRPGMRLGGGTWLALGLLAGLVICIVLFAQLLRRERWSPKLRAILAVSCTAVFLLAVLPPNARFFLQGPDGESQSQRNDRLGLLAGLYAGALSNAAQPPDAYTEEHMNALLRQVQQAVPPEQNPAGQRPNIVLIMSESFCDPTALLPGVDFQDDPIPHFHALAEQWPSGRFLSNTYAGGTGNVEMEVLTGIPIGFLSEGEDLTSLKDPTAYNRGPSIVRTLQEQGYVTSFVHSYNDRLYNRADNLPRVGYETILFERDFPADAQRDGPYLTDLALTQQLITQFEHRDKDKPLFLFGLSMENHQPYFGGKFPSPSGVRFQAPSLSESDRGTLDSLFHGLRGADEGLQALLDYFETCGEPVLVVFWGDHLPSLYTDSGYSLYSHLGYVESDDTKTWSPAVMKQMHTTPFLVWNNFGADLDVPETVGATGLGAQILRWAGAQRPLFFQWSDTARADLLLYRQRLFVDGNGTPSYTPSAASAETVETYRSIIYDLIYGEGYLTRDLLTLPSTR